MKIKILVISIVMVCSSLIIAQTGGHDQYGIFAPKDAYLNGSKFPYYGSENAWNRRMFTKKRADKFYKRRGQREMLMILDGKLNEAVKTCRNYVKKNPDDLESMFVLTVALTQQGKINEAYKEMLNTIKAGMSFSRFLSGPRNLLKSLYESSKFKSYYKKHPIEILEGPMIGAVTGNSAKFWVRTVHQVPVTIYIYSEKSSNKLIGKFTSTTKATDDYTGVITVKNLKPNSKYYYDVFVKNKFVFGKQKPSFNTFYKRGNNVKFSIGFGGGAGYIPKHEYIWNTINSFKLSAMLLLGDNVYIDVPGMPNAVHYYTYYRRESQPYFKNLVKQTPIFTIWDDHDAAFDDIWLGPYVNKPAWKQPMLKVFREQWANPGYGTKKTPGVWYKFYNGNVEFFMLDCRTYRTDPFAPNPSMIGPVQKKWLFKELKKSKAVFKVIVSSVPWAFGAKPGSHDPWLGFPAEREQIFSYIADNKINGVILVSADRHRSDAWIIDRKKGYNLYEFESSKLTNMHTHHIMPGSIFGYNKTCSFGILDFDTTVKDPKVRYRIVNIDGEIMNSIMIRKSELEVK